MKPGVQGFDFEADPRRIEESFSISLKFTRLDLPHGHSASESGAQDTRTPDASRLPGVSERREASGERRVHRRFLGERSTKRRNRSPSHWIPHDWICRRYPADERGLIAVYGFCAIHTTHGLIFQVATINITPIYKL